MQISPLKRGRPFSNEEKATTTTTTPEKDQRCQVGCPLSQSRPFVLSQSYGPATHSKPKEDSTFRIGQIYAARARRIGQIYAASDEANVWHQQMMLNLQMEQSEAWPDEDKLPALPV